MKNLNKVFAMLLVVAMMMTSVVFADFSDVAEDAAYAEAVNVGAALELFKGYEDGTFKPEGDITRAEFAAIVVRALNQEAQAASAANAASDFTDVAEDHWAKGYINIVSKMGIVNGYGDGTFGPENNVLFEEAVKMLVVALGYEPAIGTAGYPVGYLTKAADIGLTNGVSATNGVAANRGVVAQLTVNALDTPLMKQTGYGTWVDYVVCDGYNDTKRETLLVDNLGIYKLGVTVNSSSATKATSKYVDEYVEVSYRKNYSGRDSDSIFAWHTDGYYTTSKITVGETKLSDLVGANALVYVAYDPNSNDDPVAVYAAKDTTKTYEMSVAADQREAVTGATVRDNVHSGLITFEYWEEETDRKATVITIKADPKVYVNGGFVDDTTDVAVDALKDYYGMATFQLLGDADDFDYDTIFIDTYETIVVDENNTNRCRITSKNDTDAIVYDPEDNTVKATLYDENGEEMDWADLVEGDMVSIKRFIDGTTDKEIVTGTKISTTITGTVTGVSDEGLATVEFTIGDADYGIDPNAIDADEIVLGDEGTFYLDALGNITYYETTATTNTNYAFVVQIGEGGNSLDSRAGLKLYTFDGQYGTINTAQKVKVDGVSGIDTADVKAGTMTKDMSQAEYDSLVKKQGTTWFDSYTDGTLTIKDIAAGQVITYTVNSSGYITAIDRPAMEDTFGTGVSIKGKFSQKNDVAAELEYNDNTGAVTSTETGRMYITDKTVIMVVEKDNLANDETVVDLTEDDFTLFSTANIVDEQKFYNAYAYNVDDDKNVGFILVTQSVEIDGAGAVLALVSSVGSSSNAAGDSIWTIKAVQDGESKLLATADDTVDVAQFSTIYPKYNAAGEVKDVVELANIANDGLFDADAIAGLVSDKTKYYYGDVTEIAKKSISIANGVGTTIDVESGTYVYVYDAGLKSANRVQIDDVSYVSYDVDDEDVGHLYVGKDEVTVKALAREYDGDLVELVLYIFR